MDQYKTEIQFDLIPTWWKKLPKVNVSFGQDQRVVELESSQTLVFDQTLLPGDYTLTIELVNKESIDTNIQNNKDMLVEINNLSVNGITHQKLLYAGVYTPHYPKPWASQQTNLQPTITGATVLGWNGIWQLDISVPAFVWCHKTIGLGYIL